MTCRYRKSAFAHGVQFSCPRARCVLCSALHVDLCWPCKRVTVHSGFEYLCPTLLSGGSYHFLGPIAIDGSTSFTFSTSTAEPAQKPKPGFDLVRANQRNEQHAEPNHHRRVQPRISGGAALPRCVPVPGRHGGVVASSLLIGGQCRIRCLVGISHHFCPAGTVPIVVDRTDPRRSRPCGYRNCPRCLCGVHAGVETVQPKGRREEREAHRCRTGRTAEGMEGDWPCGTGSQHRQCQWQ